MYIQINNGIMFKLLTQPPYKINPQLSSINWETEYNSKFVSFKSNTPISKIRTKKQIKKPVGQCKITLD